MNRKIYRHKPTGELFKQTNTLEIRGMEDMESDGLTLPIWLVEQSDDWEEVKEDSKYIGIIVGCEKKEEKLLGVSTMKEEPNYLITAFRFKDSLDIWDLKKDGLYGATPIISKYTLEEMLNGSISVSDNSIEIYSVKNYKGEEFTIGDTIKYEDDKCIGPVFKIHNFFINRDNILLARSSMESAANCEDINTIYKIKSPIYTTTDGVEVFEGDRVILHILGKENTIGELKESVVLGAFSKQDKEVADRYLTFTSAENRDKYIKENQRKPVFISADGKEFYSGDTDYSLFSVLPKANWQENRYRLNDCIKFPKKEWLHFHTKEARQEYIDNNKPKYSLTDFKQVLKWVDDKQAEIALIALKKLGK